MCCGCAEEKKKKLKSLLLLVDDKGNPNLNALSDIVKDVRLIELNIKVFRYELARRLAQALPVRIDTVARHVGLQSKASTQDDIESDWVAHWAGQLGTPVIFHRKLWELAYVLQVLHEHGCLHSKTRGLGFGCGTESIPSYLASRGIAVTVTDLAHEDAEAKGWVATNQHLRGRDSAFFPHLVDRLTFDRLVDFRTADMNHIPDDLADYDFCWSMCAIEHLGSIEKGLAFIENALRTVRPGGISVHTLEYNIEDEGPTVDNWPTVLFQRKHLEAVAARLRKKGHHVAEFNYDLGAGPMDKFIDLPPWNNDVPAATERLIAEPRHLKLGLDGFVATCFGIIVRKAERAVP